MADARDNYEAYYQDKLWSLIPSIYRTLDSDDFNANGPLREMVNRIGAQAAIVRRSVDRLWEDQSIETCDDWVIAYIGDLLATNLVASLDSRGQRIDVAKTIYYRRRKGTLAILEEIAADITGWNAHCVEFFRLMGRTRHSFDPQIAGPVDLLLEEKLVGRWTSSPAGGWADLRNRYGASKTASAFDEFAHTADMRRGIDKVGWHNISHLGVFLWRLYSFELDETMPVASTACPGQFSFDPTGRMIPLFAVASRDAASYGDNWISPQEWQLPGLIPRALLQSALLDPATIPLYATEDINGVVTPNSVGVYTHSGLTYELVDSSHFLDASKRTTIDSERGVFQLADATTGPFFVTYDYGFSSRIGAGPYNRRVPGVATPVLPQPIATVTASAAIPDPSPTGTVTIGDSLTYSSIADVLNVDTVTLQAQQSRRPVLRQAAGAAWTLNGSGATSVLVLEGLFVSGGDVILTGTFDSVTIRCCTLDPGSLNETSAVAESVDGRPLAPCHLWIEAEIASLTLDRSITGPIHTRQAGSVESLSANDSIVQGIRTSDTTQPLTTGDILDPRDLAQALRGVGTLAVFLHGKLAATTQTALASWDGVSDPPAALTTDIITDFNALLTTAFYTPALFSGITLSASTLKLAATDPSGPQLVSLNRLLLEEAFPVAFAAAAIALGIGEANLSRTTVLGRMFVHRLEASECILDDFAVVEDTQHGCVRFTAFASGSVLPRQYESLRMGPRSAIFTSRVFGQPGYAQLLSSADAAVLSPATGTILAGAQDGSEMGAFAREKNSIKERSILIKYQEFMPLGLAPVLVRVT